MLLLLCVCVDDDDDDDDGDDGDVLHYINEWSQARQIHLSWNQQY